MLTAAQCATVGWYSKDMDIFCDRCADLDTFEGPRLARLSSYSAGEMADEQRENVTCNDCGRVIAKYENEDENEENEDDEPDTRNVTKTPPGPEDEEASS